jgi:hypothetical protein
VRNGSRQKKIPAGLLERCAWLSVDLAIECFRLLLEWLKECRRIREGEIRSEETEETRGECSSCVPTKSLPPRLVTMRTRGYYAVAVGQNPGIYETWYEAAEQVVGYGGNVHQAFNTREEAELFLRRNRGR